MLFRSVDNASGGGENETVNKMVGKVTLQDGKPRYDGVVAQILRLGGFEVKVMIRDGETNQDLISLLGGGVLGVPWNPELDQMTFKFSINLSTKSAKEALILHPENLHLLEQEELTHRKVLSAIYSIYDPLGQLTPVTIGYKILLREVVRLKLGWDDPLPKELADKFKKKFRELVMAEDVVFPRSVKPVGTSGPLEILGFWDGDDPASGHASTQDTSWTSLGQLGKHTQ